jgi:glutathione S-transferase
MAFTLHGSSEFTCTRRVALIAKERNVPYRLITVDVKGGEHKQPAHLKHQPFGQVPYIIVRGLSTSCRYAMSLMRFFILSNL